VSLALPAALVQGALTAFLNCGVASMAASRPPRVMRAFTSGQALAGACHCQRRGLGVSRCARSGGRRRARNDAAARVVHLRTRLRLPLPLPRALGGGGAARIPLRRTVRCPTARAFATVTFLVNRYCGRGAAARRCEPAPLLQHAATAEEDADADGSASSDDAAAAAGFDAT
jgi:hypothetical protein